MRGRWTWLTAVAGATAGVLALLPVGAQSARSPRCEDRSGRTVGVDSRTRLYATVKPKGFRQVMRLLACRPGRRAASKPLDRWTTSDDFSVYLGKVRLPAGSYAAVQESFLTGVSGGEVVAVYDLRPGRPARAATVGIEANGEDTDFVATKSGGVAVLVVGAAPRLMAYDASGERELSNAAVTDLAATGDTVYWTEAGAARSATVTGPPADD